jgi:hypothetical protein
MLNRIKNWDYKNINISQNNIVTLAMVLSIMALVMSIPSSSNCASADSCTVSSTGTFTGNMAIKSGTNYTLTQQHSFSQNVIANWQDVGGTHTGTVIMKDSAGDMDLNGGLKLGTSATSTSGTIRWNGTAVQYVNAGGVWGDIDTTASPSNSFGVVDTTSGSVTAGSTGDTVTIVGAGGITTSATGSTVTVTGSSSTASAGARFLVSSGYTHTTQNDVMYDTENYDINGCWTINTTASDTTLEYTCETTRAFVVNSWLSGAGSIVYEMEYRYQVNSGATQIGYFGGRDFPANAARGIGGTATVCLNQNDEFHSKWGNATSGNAIYGGLNLTAIEFHEDTELTAYAASQTCTDGLFN